MNRGPQMADTQRGQGRDVPHRLDKEFTATLLKSFRQPMLSRKSVCASGWYSPGEIWSTSTSSTRTPRAGPRPGPAAPPRGPPPLDQPAHVDLHLIKVFRRDELRQGDVAEPLVPESDVVRAIDREVLQDRLLQQTVEQALAPGAAMT